MAKDCRVGSREALLILALAATLSVVLRPAMLPTVGATEQQAIIIKNSSLCSGVNGDGDGEDNGGGCLAIAQAQPELEGFEMTVDLGSGGVFHRSLVGQGGYFPNTGNTKNPDSAGCGRDKPDYRYYSCTTAPSSSPINPQKCSATTRDNPCST